MKAALIRKRKKERFLWRGQTEELKFITLYWRWWHVHINYPCLASSQWVVWWKLQEYSDILNFNFPFPDSRRHIVWSNCPGGTNVNRPHMQTNLAKILQMKVEVDSSASESGMNGKLSVEPWQQPCNPSAYFKGSPLLIKTFSSFLFLYWARNASLTFSQSDWTQPEAGKQEAKTGAQ